MAKETPLMQQYYEIKELYSDAILLFQIGDFYETFNEDAETLSSVLDITLTSRDKDKDNPTPLAGFPMKALDTHLSKLLGNGFTVAIAEQVENPQQAKGLVKRQITQVVTPGTVYQSTALDSKQNNYLGAISKNKDTFSFAYIDISTGEIKVTEINNRESLLDEIQKIRPAELLIPKKLSLGSLPKSIILQSCDNDFYDKSKSIDLLKDTYSVHNLEGLGLDHLDTGLLSLGALIQYIKKNHFNNLDHLQDPLEYSIYETMILSPSVIESLEIINSKTQGNSLLEVIDETMTSMGSRKLRNWLLHPLIEKTSIEKRIEKVTYFYQDSSLSENIRNELKDVMDIERLIGRIGFHKAHPRDLIGLRNSLLASIEIIDKTNEEFSLKPLVKESAIEVIEYIEKSIKPEPPANTNSGGYIKPDFDSKLNKLRNNLSNSKSLLEEYQVQQRQETGIESLKVDHNKVWGYYVEVTKTHKDKIPDHYEHKQTLTNSIRYTTTKLREIEENLTTSQEKSIILEAKLFEQILSELSSYLSDLQKLANKIAYIDVVNNLSYIAKRDKYTKPKFKELDPNANLLKIKKGKHPVLYHLDPTTFIPNDATFNNNELLHILTGPNMSGKSTYLRQNALLVLLAQIGSYVPAEEMDFNLVDRIFTRIGAGDDISSGKSTFMLEMSELSSILKNATANSLLILDEIGRGTSTYDGLSIAWATTKFISNKLRARTLFATHYHELTELGNQYKNISNYTIDIHQDEEDKNDVKFLYKVKPGTANKSYGIHVAQMAGIPQNILKDAESILSEFEQVELFEEDRISKQQFQKSLNNPKNKSLFQDYKDPRIDKYKELVKTLKEIKINQITPLKAIELLARFKDKAENETND